MNFLDDETDEEIYEKINQNNPDVNVTSMSLIVTEGKYGAIDTYGYSCHGYCIINVSSSPYTRAGLNPKIWYFKMSFIFNSIKDNLRQ